jgi:mannosyl-3-phosphoglycerate phosphatase
MYIIFSDLDGTLLDEETYSFKESIRAIKLLKEKKIPLILCSSKTRFEIELYRQKMDIMASAFISENGGGIFVPKGRLSLKDYNYKVVNGYQVIELGKSYASIKNYFQEIRANLMVNTKSLSEMKAIEISKITNLSLKEARLAIKREYSLPFIFNDNMKRFFILKRAIKEYGLKLIKGARFYSLSGGNDKGKAVQILKSIYKRSYPKTVFVTIGIGDGPNDISMLKEVEIPIFVRKKTGAYETHNLKNIYYTQGVGPKGFAEAIFRIIGKGGNP